ncbi:uncharacterized protein PGTG_20720 [Puccinia graminis f. sp. tritici CRL 75-36-700-3]|uniref:Uncharacterized protein n=1 Tax=Puccinia graminis f. sp. tritici (strain CRL 75-36-700-3 / race SCCL) TaxID=418459 RepID=H6QP21_PUCGT|nr:uncharacterized protein PGTG_20720 [Puccinia graminis f. sp. tritici CRL 75-36-700-3]EHS63135.1 hypothetical protein PGTG_20720 [Puccinia graminis f. sp. tritici CRL 75-36-700-3]
MCGLQKPICVILLVTNRPVCWTRRMKMLQSIIRRTQGPTATVGSLGTYIHPLHQSST